LDNNLSPTEEHYLIKGNSKKTLFVMAIGLKDACGNELVDNTKPPWSKLTKKDVKPLLKDLIEEINRRSSCTKAPKCKSWKAHACTTWLIANPIVGEDDVIFIRRRCEEFDAASQAADTEKLAASDGNWRGSVPYLRIILCLIEDIRDKFAHRDDPQSRVEFDGRNSDTRKSTVYELIAERWNSDTFNPVLGPSLAHEDFREPTDCAFSNVRGLAKATALKIQNYISSMRADLSRMIQNWELSGQGDCSIPAGQGNDDDDDGLSLPKSVGSDDFPETPVKPAFGNLAGRTPHALNSRQIFLNGLPSYLLILWEMADDHQLLSSTLQRLDNDVAAVDASSAPSVVVMRRGGRPSPTFSEQTDGGGTDLAKSLEKYNVECSIRTINQQLSELTDKKDDRELLQFSAATPALAALIQKQIDAIDAEMEELHKERRRLARKANLLD
jgi:hypothetical protein